MSIKNILVIAGICILISVGAVSAVDIEGNSFIGLNCIQQDYLADGDAVELDGGTISEKYVNLENKDVILVLYSEGHTTNKFKELGYEYKTINQTKGYFLDNGTEVNFVFDYGDNTIIMISASNESIIEKIVIGNDFNKTMELQGIDSYSS